MDSWRLDFIGEKESKEDFSAIVINFFEGDREVLGVYDCGLMATGEALLQQLDNYLRTHFY